MKIALPRKVIMIINNLQLHGYEAYAVGGCVRDSILAKRPEDWDITTSARPEEIKRLFRRTVDTGIEHGTVTVLIGKDAVEVTTYRIDGAYEDSRHPKEVRFTNRLEEDLRRRDFTINAMAYNDDARLVDVFGGMKDLNHHLIRCVGENVFLRMPCGSCVRSVSQRSLISLLKRKPRRRSESWRPLLTISVRSGYRRSW